MRKFKMIMMAFVGAGAMAMAGGDITPVEPEVTIPEYNEPVEAKNPLAGIYVGAGYGYGTVDVGAPVSQDENFDSLVLQAGYKINDFVALEARYWMTSELDNGDTVDTYGLYVKPMYPVTPEVDVYALLGYGDSTSGDETDGFQWGLGASYNVSENVAVFADYVNVYDDTIASIDYTIDTVNVGVTYKF